MASGLAGVLCSRVLWGGRKTKPLLVQHIGLGVAPLRSGLLGALLIVVSFVALTIPIGADQTVTVTTTVAATSCIQAQTVNALGFLLLLVLIFAAVVIIYLVRLYRRTKF